MVWWWYSIIVDIVVIIDIVFHCDDNELLMIFGIEELILLFDWYWLMTDWLMTVVGWPDIMMTVLLFIIVITNYVRDIDDIIIVDIMTCVYGIVMKNCGVVGVIVDAIADIYCADVEIDVIRFDTLLLNWWCLLLTGILFLWY